MAARKLHPVSLSATEVGALEKLSGKHRAREFRARAAREDAEDRLNAKLSATLRTLSAAEKRAAAKLVRSQEPGMRRWLDSHRPTKPRRAARLHNPIRTPPYDLNWWTWEHAGSGVKFGPAVHDRMSGGLGSWIYVPYAGRVRIETAVGIWIPAWASGTLRVTAYLAIDAVSLCFAAGAGWASTSTQVSVRAASSSNPSDERHANYTIADLSGVLRSRTWETETGSRPYAVTRPVTRYERYNLWVSVYQKVTAIGAGIASSNVEATLYSLKVDILP